VKNVFDYRDKVEYEYDNQFDKEYSLSKNRGSKNAKKGVRTLISEDEPKYSVESELKLHWELYNSLK